ncbi:MAG TPA: glycosyltransferase family 2 protein [Patescibacteria group bacterium]|nr:glycosyltransferase family 2 protein [Patescibacteria group bacterium]
MSSKLISVIVPVYNHAHTLERAVDSIFNQTHRPLQVVIVNDGGTDNFSKVMDKIKINYPTLDLQVINQDNSGAPAARNRGFKEAKGDYVIFWDADTIGEPFMLEKMVETLENNAAFSYAYSQFKFGWKVMKSQEFDPVTLQKFNYIDGVSLIRRADVIPWDESLKRFQDWDLWLTMLEQKKTGINIPEVLFSKIVKGRKNISAWLPRFVYKLPWKTKAVRAYEEAREVVLKKHGLI